MAKRHNKKRTVIAWVTILVVLVVAIVVGMLIWNNVRQNNDTNEDTETSEIEEKAAKKEKEIGEDDEEEMKGADSEVDEKKVVQYDGEDPNKANDLSGVVTYAAVNGGTLTIRVNIDQYLTEGECKLTLSRDGATIYNSRANIIGVASTSSCEGFDVPTGGLGGGKTEIVINISAGERSGVIRGEVNV